MRECEHVCVSVERVCVCVCVCEERRVQGRGEERKDDEEGREGTRERCEEEDKERRRGR